jgi:hypothetical protein
MDGSFFNDLKAPFIVADVAAVTLSTTNKALYPIANIAAMGRDYWWVGKKVRVEAFGRITTAATPGNLTLALLYGTGADANGTTLAASAAQTLAASQTNISWRAHLTVHCRAVGVSGSLFCVGEAQFGAAVIAVGDFLLPASAAAAATVDLTVAGNVLSLQALRSGSTAETMQVHDLSVIALN